MRSGNERPSCGRGSTTPHACFWETDQKKKLADRVEDLKAVTFLKDLSEGDAAPPVLPAGGAHGCADAERRRGGRRSRAAELSKSDLTTELVKEFTELQGVVGGLYARVQGEPESVWRAIYDQYKPESMDDAIPRDRVGQMVSLVDKIDTLRSCFGVGLIPTGSRDPYGLRRAAQGVVRILVEGEVRGCLMHLPVGRQ